MSPLLLLFLCVQDSRSRHIVVSAPLLLLLLLLLLLVVVVVIVIVIVIDAQMEVECAHVDADMRSSIAATRCENADPHHHHHHYHHRPHRHLSLLSSFPSRPSIPTTPSAVHSHSVPSQTSSLHDRLDAIVIATHLCIYRAQREDERGEKRRDSERCDDE